MGQLQKKNLVELAKQVAETITYQETKEGIKWKDWEQ